MSQQELAVAVGKSVRAVNDWENDRTSPRNSIGAIEAVLHVRLDDDEDGGEADALPQLVADNQHDPRVMEIWAMRYLARSTKLAHIAYLLEREGPVARQPGTVTNGRPLAL